MECGPPMITPACVPKPQAKGDVRGGARTLSQRVPPAPGSATVTWGVGLGGGSRDVRVPKKIAYVYDQCQATRP